MGIPEMGFAFIACYAIWLDGPDLEALSIPRAKRVRGGA
jgi:hypothetical protein